jgi:hypothetical protein
MGIGEFRKRRKATPLHVFGMARSKTDRAQNLEDFERDGISGAIAVSDVFPFQRP